MRKKRVKLFDGVQIISIKSPIAQALLNKGVGDVVEVRVPAGLVKLRIDTIQ